MTEQLILSNKIPTNRLTIFSIQFPVFAWIVLLSLVHFICITYLTSFDLYIFWTQNHWIVQTLYISPSCNIMFYLGLWELTLNLRLFFLFFFFFWGSQILDSFSSLMVPFFLNLLKKALHILKIRIHLYFPFLKKRVSRLVFNSTGIYFCIWPEVEI